MATKLGLYNGALKLIGERRLANITEAVESRRTLDDVYDDVLAYCLEQGQWWFARREAEIDSDATAPTFGYQFRFAKPTDWVRTMAISSDEYFHLPLEHASDQPDWWYADIDPIWVAYVSDDAAFGGDLTRWPPTYARFVEYELAKRISQVLTQAKSDYALLIKEHKRAKRDALNKDAMNDIQPKHPPTGSVVRSRLAGHDSYAGHFKSGTYWR